MAKISPREDVEVIELAPRGLVKLGLPIPGMSLGALPAYLSLDWTQMLLRHSLDSSSAAETGEDYGITYLRHMMQYNGRAQCILSPDMMPQDGQ